MIDVRLQVLCQEAPAQQQTLSVPTPKTRVPNKRAAAVAVALPKQPMKTVQKPKAMPSRQAKVEPGIVPPAKDSKDSKAASRPQGGLRGREDVELLDRPCHMCRADLSEVQEATVDAMGNRVEDGCLHCVTTLTKGWPGWTWVKGCSL